MFKYKWVKAIPITLLIIISAICCFYKLSSSPLERWDEYTNFQVVQSQSFFPLQYRSEPFFEKPPLWYWLTILSTKIFGLNNFSTRFVSAISGFFVIILTYLIGKRYLSSKAGLIAGFILLATPQLFLKNSYIFSTHTFRSADLDSLQILFLLATSFCLIESTSAQKKYFWIMLSGLFTALGFLTKGPFALLPFTVFMILAIFNKGHKIQQLIPIFLIFHFSFFICILPWHIYMTLDCGDAFLDTYFGYHIFQRGLMPIEDHGESIFFYIKLLFRKDFFLFGEILIISLISIIRQLSKDSYRAKQKYTLLFCTIISLSYLIAISLIQTKLSWYLLPIYPFIAILIGQSVMDITKMIVMYLRKSKS